MCLSVSILPHGFCTQFLVDWRLAFRDNFQSLSKAELGGGWNFHLEQNQMRGNFGKLATEAKMSPAEKLKQILVLYA